MPIYIFRTCDKYRNPHSMRDYCVTTDPSMLVKAIGYAIEDGAVNFHWFDEELLPEGEVVEKMTAKLEEIVAQTSAVNELIYHLDNELYYGMIRAYEDGKILQ